MTDQEDTVESFTMPSNPKDREDIKDRLREMSGLLEVIDNRRDDIKAYAEALESSYKIPKKISNKMARVLHKNTYGEVTAEADQFTSIFETLFQDSDED